MSIDAVPFRDVFTTNGPPLRGDGETDKEDRFALDLRLVPLLWSGSSSVLE